MVSPEFMVLICVYLWFYPCLSVSICGYISLLFSLVAALPRCVYSCSSVVNYYSFCMSQEKSIVFAHFIILNKNFIPFTSLTSLLSSPRIAGLGRSLRSPFSNSSHNRLMILYRHQLPLFKRLSWKY